jgi:hypothetical protein
VGGSLSGLVPELQEPANALLDAAGRAGLLPRITSTVRTRSEQRRLYNRFLAGQSGYPVAPPGASAHEYGLAFDMVVSPMEALADVGYTWQSWGGGWNGADAVHFELPGASEWARTQAEPQTGGAVGSAVRSWSEWFADLPWWAQVLMPISTMTKSTPMTYADVQRVAKRFGINL